jgi:hypothetical protein
MLAMARRGAESLDRTLRTTADALRELKDLKLT